ncbi:hypothetical protein GIB67_007876 [Kingdonia uniflora]|uniref:CCHC-type domain-containing protein n=1 Tax=Kingdonia uniflora TaxID=39325 RepID=A0A7J7PAW7_9MAGN|nr:hypothetical protein GIB67_007876 [Kingdonia uniflora]
MGRSKYFNVTKFDVEKFNGKINFGLWQIQVQDIFTQDGLRKALNGKPIPKTRLKSLSNRLYLMEQLHTLKMNEGTSVGDHLGFLNGIVLKLESIGVKVEDEDMALQLIRFKNGTCWSCGQSGHYRSDCKIEKGIGASSTRGSESDTNKLATVTSNDGDVALLVVAADGFHHDRGWVFDSGAIMHVCTHKA